jgi:SPP1 family predicted phage head-tail adaptor
MNPGVLNCRVDIQTPTLTVDAYNQPVESGYTSTTTWAEAVTKGGTEFYAAQKLHADCTVVFRIRYRSTVTPQCRVVYGGRTFEVLNVNDVALRHVEMLLSCREVV